jgi:hypothetical protein
MNEPEWMLKEFPVVFTGDVTHKHIYTTAWNTAQKQLLEYLIGFSNNQRRDYSISSYELKKMLNELEANHE